MESDTKDLKTLGKGLKTKYELDKPNPDLLETFDNQHPSNLYVVPIEAFEVSTLCPKTGQPDFAKIYINYVPNKKCIESKSLKLYLFSLRNHGEFMEDLTNRLMNELVKKLDPYYIEVYGKFNSRGGISLTPVAMWEHDDVNFEGREEIKFALKRMDALT